MTMNSQGRTLDLILNSCLSSVGPSKGCPGKIIGTKVWGSSIPLRDLFLGPGATTAAVQQASRGPRCLSGTSHPSHCSLFASQDTAYLLSGTLQSALAFGHLPPHSPHSVLRAPGRVFGRCLTTPSPPSGLLPL